MTATTWARGLFAFGSVALSLFFVVLHARTTAIPYDPFGTARFGWSAFFVVTYLTAAYAFGLPDIPRSRPTALVAGISAVVTSLTVVSLLQLALGTALLPRLFSFGVAPVLLLWANLSWSATTDLNDSAADKALVVAGPALVAELAAELLDGTERPVELVGSVSPDDVEMVEAMIKSCAPDLVVIDVRAQSDDRIVRCVADAHQTGVRIRTLSLFYEEYLGKIPLADMQRTSLLFDIGELHRIIYTRGKRLLDLMIGLVAAPILLLVLPFVAIGNLIGNRGSIFFTQPRVGKDGAEFRIVKFRSMTAGGSNDWTAESDPRITRFGGFLRRSHLDELPQVINILRGDLSVVGPRPEQPHYVIQLTEKIPYFEVRHLVRPGLTGWAQVKYPYGANEADAREKLQYDLYYLRRQSMLLDLRVVFRTLRSVMSRSGR